MAAGSCASARSSSASSTIAASACKNPSPRPVDLWITLAGYPQPHRPNSHHNRDERNRKTVTHLVGQTCYLCRRLLRGEGPAPTDLSDRNLLAAWRNALR